jgi:hypothetical protein
LEILYHLAHTFHTCHVCLNVNLEVRQLKTKLKVCLFIHFTV